METTTRCATSNCQGDETSVRKLLGEPSGQQLARSPTKLQKHLGQELESSQAQDLGTVPESLSDPCGKLLPSWLLLHAQTREVGDVCAGCERLTANLEAVRGASQPVQGQKSNPACQQALACVTLPRASDAAGKELP